MRGRTPAIVGTLVALGCQEEGHLPEKKTGFEDCDQTLDNGYETDVKTSTEHCGSCNFRCEALHAAASCVAGECKPRCEDGFGSCEPFRPFKGCMNDLKSSPQHCGACDKRCAEAYCRAGACEAPVHVAAIGDASWLLFVFDGHAYVQQHYLLPAASAAYAKAPAGGEKVVVDEEATRVTPRGFIPVAHHGEHFFGCKAPVQPLGSDCRLVRARFDGGEMKELALVPKAHMHKIVADDAHVYIAAEEAERRFTIQAVPIDGGEPRPIATVVDLFSFGARAGSLYWSTTGPLGTQVLHRGDSKPEPIWDRSCWEIATDATHLYCTDNDELFRMPLPAKGKPPGTPEWLARTRGGDFDGLVVTDDAIYYGSHKIPGLVDVFRIRKPAPP